MLHRVTKWVRDVFARRRREKREREEFECALVRLADGLARDLLDAAIDGDVRAVRIISRITE